MYQCAIILFFYVHRLKKISLQNLHRYQRSYNRRYSRKASQEELNISSFGGLQLYFILPLLA